MATWFGVCLVFVLLLVPLIISIRRGADLFVIVVRGGKAHFVRGRMPQSLLQDFGDVVAEPPIAEARIKAVLRDGAAELQYVGSVPEGQRQQLRNVLAGYSLARIRAGGRPVVPRR